MTGGFSNLASRDGTLSEKVSFNYAGLEKAEKTRLSPTYLFIQRSVNYCY